MGICGNFKKYICFGEFKKKKKFESTSREIDREELVSSFVQKGNSAVGQLGGLGCHILFP